MSASNDPNDIEQSKWIEEYKDGMGHEMYRTTLSVAFSG